MSAYFRDWLKTQLTQMVDVRGCVPGTTTGILARAHLADLRVGLWTGNVVHIYIIAEALKTRAIKNIVQRDTGDSIGTMFMVAPHLVPQSGQRLSPSAWLLALQALNNDRIYTYPPEDREARLLQFHLERHDTPDSYGAIYGPHVKIEKLHFGRVAIKPRAVKGFWTMAHFGAEAFWQPGKATHYVPPPRRQYSRASEQHTSGQQAAPSSPAASPSQLESCYTLLGINSNTSHEEVKMAFRQRVFSAHPDVSDLPKAIAEEKFRALAEAYDYIKVERGWS